MLRLINSQMPATNSATLEQETTLDDVVQCGNERKEVDICPTLEEFAPNFGSNHHPIQILLQRGPRDEK